MPSNLYRIKQSGTGYPTVRGATLLAVMQQLRTVWGQVKAEREAIIQGKDDTDDYTTPANVYGFVASDGTTITEAVAEEAFLELDSLITNHQAAIEQACARFLQ